MNESLTYAEIRSVMVSQHDLADVLSGICSPERISGVILVLSGELETVTWLSDISKILLKGGERLLHFWTETTAKG